MRGRAHSISLSFAISAFINPPADVGVRIYRTTAVITGRTQMSGQLGETPFATENRYTHVYVEEQGRWRLVTAQGTQITDN